MDDPILDTLKHSQRISHKFGAASVAVEVYGWAIKHALEIPLPAFKELMDMIGKEPSC